MATQLPSWSKLDAHFTATKGTTMRELFANDAGRASAFSASAEGIHLDYSKNIITTETVTT